MASGKQVLVTGASGFTGQYMLRELESAGYRVTGAGSQPAVSQSFRQIDLRDRASLDACLQDVRPDYVIHLAALAFVQHDDPAAFYDVNLVGTRNLLEATAKLGSKVQRVLLASSANVYGNATAGVLDEDSKLAPANDYAVSKMAMEAMAALWQSKLPIVITRPFNYTGVGQADQFLLPKIVAHFRRKAPAIELGNIDVSRDFSDVRSVVNAYRRLLECDSAGKLVNVCSGQAYSLMQVIDFCREITGHDLEININPAFVRQNEVKTLCGSSAQLTSLIGPWHQPTLKSTLQWMLEARC